MRRPFFVRSAIVSLLGFAILAAGASHAAEITLLNVSYDPTRELYQDFNAAFAIFADAGLLPDIVLSALDADVIKTYVELGLGVGIIASMAYDPRKDTGLVLLDGAAVFPTNTTHIAIRRGHYLRSYAYRFIALCAERLSETVVRAASAPPRDAIDQD